MSQESRQQHGAIHEGAIPSSPIPPPTTVVFDRASMMARVMDDEALARAVIACFLDDMPRQFETLRGYLETGDAAGVQRLAHSTRSASSYVGGEALSAVAFEMEKAGKAGDLDAAKARLPELEAQYELLKQALTKERI